MCFVKPFESIGRFLDGVLAMCLLLFLALPVTIVSAMVMAFINLFRKKESKT